MTEKPNAPAAETADSGADLRGQLIRRLSVAAIIVALLLGILTIFDYLSQAPEEDEVPVFTQPVPVAPKKPATQPLRLLQMLRTLRQYRDLPTRALLPISARRADLGKSPAAS